MSEAVEHEGWADEASGLQIFPVFLIVDTSGSMNGNRIDAANELVPAIRDVCAEDSSVAGMLRLGVLSFDSSARVEVPFGPTSSIDANPVLKASGLTSYGAAFLLARDEVDRALSGLRADGYQSVVRPTIFFITDGEPTDDRVTHSAAFDELRTSSYSPNVFAFGVDGAKIDTLKQFTNRRGFAAVSKDDAVEGLRKLIPQITQSIVQSMHNAGESDSGPALIMDRDDFDDDDWLLD